MSYPRTIVEVKPEGLPTDYEAEETSDAKDFVYEVVSDAYEYLNLDVTDQYPDKYDPITIADAIVEGLISHGWRPTQDA